MKEIEDKGLLCVCRKVDSSRFTQRTSIIETKSGLKMQYTWVVCPECKKEYLVSKLKVYPLQLLQGGKK